MLPLKIQQVLALVLCALLVVGCSSGSDSGSSDSGGDGGGDESEELTDAGIESLEEASSEALLVAVDLFEEALASDPTNDVARTLLAVSELLAFLDEANHSSLVGSACGMDLETLLARLDMEMEEGTTIFSLIDGTASLPDPPEGGPSDPPTGTELQSFFRCELIPLLQDTAEKLEDVSLGFTHEFEEGLLGSEPFTLDHGDAHLIAGGLRGVEMMFHKLCLFELAFDPGYGDAIDVEEGLTASGSSDLPQQLFTGNSPSFVVPEQICGVENSGLFNAHAEFGTAGLLDASAEAQTHLDEWRSAGAQLLMNINEAVDGKAALEADDAEPGLIEIDSTFMCAQGVWLPWLVDMVDALEGGDSSVAAVDVEDICGIEIHLPALELPGELFEAATYSNRPFLPSYGIGECYFVAPISFAHINDSAYANLHALAAVLKEDGVLTKEDMYDVWVKIECRWERDVNDWAEGCGLWE